MKLHVIDTGFFKLDGGAMFGVVPKSLWTRTNEADENNMCTWAMRCLLIEDGNQLILIDNGIGNKQDAKFFSHYYLHGDASLDSSLKKAGFSPNDVTDMFQTHLHFDHCGGGVDYVGDNKDKLQLHFPNAKYWSNADHWKWATEPNAREKASFLKENILPIQESGHLNQVPLDGKSPFSQFDIFFADGHTDKQMIPKIKYKDKTIVFMADLLPSTGHIPLPYVMGYDTRPLLTLSEKEKFLKEAADNEYILFLEHDSVNECCTVKNTEKGVRLDRTFPLSEVL
ncbi:glyoxylase-like metal-dependent hydrolase (beta-lactamase superfamily II) [Roseivirga ehrenbergii]|uniref:Beta-lactamase n=3 Tax=Roseivirga TaxID=290180 RepID=A0A0L8AGW0_9BACT|nr:MULTISPECIES: MBL fold metallo-hydrolase [Roseivirga]KOF01614.1 beta-lactamase [Roseivirga seohaensis subsp. aquiponti]KYG74984.1 MBL fold metallo-hydrolase [Roseivirga ehrenbergii]KYG81331.1 MBL fold metallo-hydrolase [Roseivirga seohaensis]TCL13667.1 glyoxylase-like metal-dependent hydrolase (beta-lactamase superfamily II) [Roseivirga ehrenbergii]